MNNNKGGAIVLAMALTVLVSIGIVTSMHVSKNMVDSATRQKDAIERERLASALKTMLGDQRFCGAYFSQGYNTADGTYTLNSSVTNGYAKTKLEEIENLFTVYQPGTIKLFDRKDLPADSNGVLYRQFDISVSLVPKSGFLGRLGGAFGRANSGLAGSKDWRLIVGSNNRCYVEAYDENANEEFGIASGCKALGGQYRDGRCHVNKYQSDFDGMMDATKVDLTTSNFADALCEMELSALRKMGPHMINQSTATTANAKMAMGWTSLCSKPQWAGCRASNDANFTLKHGNDPNSTNFKIAGETWTTPSIKMSKKKLGDHIEEVSAPTIMRRFNRVTGIITNDSGIPQGYDLSERLDVAVTTAVNSAKKVTIAIGGGGMAGAGAYATAAAMAHTLAAAWAAGPVGFAVAAVIMQILPKCNDVRLTHTFQCLEGYPELANLKWEKQKLKVGLSGIKCKWKNGGDIPTMTEADIYSLINGKGLLNEIISEEDLEADITGLEEVLADLENPDLTFADLIAMFNEEDSDDDEIVDYNIPKELSDAITAKELALWAKFAAEANAKLAAIAAPPRDKGETEALEDYATFLKSYYAGKAQDLKDLSDETQSYIAFSQSIKNPDGSPRSFTATAAYTSYAAPLVAKIAATGTKLKADASERGVEGADKMTFADTL